ncbi:hypothetical protein TNCT_167121 [Trichonephila clavata]|uniref:Uncharacterized protein n=1 Tax=Trichonephila clavata TaxID=2740835 RepID=A0A8X6GZQ9_TRICU|nr:hypothetical protein TNCT_167121 [Trichonephila clavata]
MKMNSGRTVVCLAFSRWASRQHTRGKSGSPRRVEPRSTASESAAMLPLYRPRTKRTRSIQKCWRLKMKMVLEGLYVPSIFSMRPRGSNKEQKQSLPSASNRSTGRQLC